MIGLDYAEGVHALSTAVGNFDYEFIEAEQDPLDTSIFPARVHSERRFGRYVVEHDPQAMAALRRDYATEDMFASDVDKLYVGTGIIDTFMLEQINVGGEDNEAIYAQMSSQDELNRQILGAPGLGDETEGKLLHYLHDELSPKIHRINGLRFAAQAIMSANADSFTGLEAHAQSRLGDRFATVEPRFVKGARAYTNNIFVARRRFAETIPLHEIAFSFPMQPPQYEAILNALGQDALDVPNSLSTGND